MTTSIRIRREAPHEAREQGGLIAAFVGKTQYVPAGSIEIEIQTDDVEFGDGRTSVGWVEDVAGVAAAAFRHADTGEMVSPAIPFPEAGDSHPFPHTVAEEDSDGIRWRAADAVDEVLDSAQGDKDGQGIITHLVNRGFTVGVPAPEPADPPFAESIRQRIDSHDELADLPSHSVIEPEED